MLLFSRFDYSKPLPKETQYLDQLFNCHTNELPLHAMVSDQVFKHPQPSLQKYYECISEEVLGGINKTIGNWAVKRTIRPAVQNRLTECESSVLPHCSQDFHIDIGCDMGSKAQTDMYDEYHMCMKTLREQVDRCINHMHKPCAETNLIVVKVIRMPIKYIGGLLKRNPDLKIIHLLRDPRGMLLSRKEKTKFVNITYEEMALDTCSKMNDDLDVSPRLMQDFPGALLQIYYEDLAIQPNKTMQRLYDHIGLPVPDEVWESVYNATHMDVEGGNFNLRRVNATETAFRWTDEMDTQEMDAVTKGCADVLKRIHYAG